MDMAAKPGAESIRRARLDNPKMRERDLASHLAISEAELVAAHCGFGATRIEPRVDDLLLGLEACGEVMALTRNESAVHEKIGVYDKVVPGRHAAMVLGADIDLRIFPGSWAHGFAVEKRDDGGKVRRSLQFFDKAGNAVHKVHARPATDIVAFEALAGRLASADQSTAIAVAEIAEAERTPFEGSADELRQRWGAMTDVHEFHGLLRSLKLTRHEAVGMVGTDYAQQLDGSALEAMMRIAVQEEMPIMCFVGNRGCIQIHSGPIAKVAPMGPWINVMDPTFHLHLRADHVRELWAVRKPNTNGHVTSVEAYGADGEMIIQFFGKRKEGEDERADWRLLVDNLPRIACSSAA
jgi:putative hemin transport protein